MNLLRHYGRYPETRPIFVYKLKLVVNNHKIVEGCSLARSPIEFANSRALENTKRISRKRNNKTRPKLVSYFVALCV